MVVYHLGATHCFIEFVSGLVSTTTLSQLPSSVTGYSPALRSTILTEVPASDIHSSTEDWITM